MKIKRSIAALAPIPLGLAVLTPGASAAGAQNEHITLLSNNAAGTTSIAIATGPIHARGTDYQLTPTKDRTTFPQGSITVVHHVGHSTDTFDPTTCAGMHTETGTYQIVDGTRAYDDARGHGTYRLTVTFVGCSQTAPPQLSQLRVDAFGPLTLGH
jgi:hypothetical protein